MTKFITCQVGPDLFQLGADSSCQLLIPSIEGDVKFTIEERSPIPAKAEWQKATIVSLPDKKAIVFGLLWNKTNLYPFIYDSTIDQWTCKKPNKKEHLPPLQSLRQWASGCYLGGVVYGCGGFSEKGWITDRIDSLNINRLDSWVAIKVQ